MKIIKFIINMVLVGVILICVYKVLDKNVKYKKADEVYEFIRNEKEDIEQGSFQIENEDYRGWININNTNIDYPILQGHDNIYYLDKDINGEYLISGSIFMNYANHGFEDKITVLFGHNMKNGTMFTDLNKYKQRDFFYGNNNIGIETTNGDYLEYEVFSVYVADAKENYIKTNFINDSEHKEFLKKIQDKSLYQSDIEIDEYNKIITLSTCSYEFNDARLVVHGRLLK